MATYNSLINACAQARPKADLDRALTVLNQMADHGVAPSVVTLSALLHAHAGAPGGAEVERAFVLFERWSGVPDGRRNKLSDAVGHQWPWCEGQELCAPGSIPVPKILIRPNIHCLCALINCIGGTRKPAAIELAKVRRIFELADIHNIQLHSYALLQVSSVLERKLHRAPAQTRVAVAVVAADALEYAKANQVLHQDRGRKVYNKLGKLVS